MSGYPTPLAGQTVTAALLGDMITTTAWKSGDTNRTSTTTAADDPDLQIPLVAGASYIIDGACYFNGGSVAATTDLNFGLAAGGTPPVSRWGGVFPSTTVTTDGDIVRVASPAINSILGYGLVNSLSMMLLVNGFITAAVTGNLTVQWAQRNTSTTALTCLAGSWLRVQRVA